jgi:hypothetical protein
MSRTVERGVLLSIAMGEGFGRANGSGRRKCIVCRCGIGIAMGSNIPQNFGMIVFMGNMEIEGPDRMR